MIGQKRPKLTPAQEREAYGKATIRDGGTEFNNIGQCQKCGLIVPCDRDHRQGRTAWNTTPANLQLLGGAFGCGCHKWKTENPADAERLGFSVPRWADPLEWPGFRHGIGWVRYFDAPVDGEWWEPLTIDQAVALMLNGGKEEDDGARVREDSS